jgi:shikimate kinase
MWSGALATPSKRRKKAAPSETEALFGAGKPRNIVLAGFMGTGKSTVGELVAEALGWRFIDTDQLIVVMEGQSIPEIFASRGEPHFRAVEERVATELAEHERVVLATGGGMLMNVVNRDALLRHGLVVCLNATAETIAARIDNDDTRPLAKGDWQGLLERRRVVYAALPYQVDTTGKTAEQVAEEVVALWQQVSQ